MHTSLANFNFSLFFSKKSNDMFKRNVNELFQAKRARSNAYSVSHLSLYILYVYIGKVILMSEKINAEMDYSRRLVFPD